MTIRTLVALVGMLLCAAKSGYGASTVATAREWEPASAAPSLEDPAGPVPESPLAVAAPLAIREPGIQIQLGTAESSRGDASPLKVPVDVSLQLN